MPNTKTRGRNAAPTEEEDVALDAHLRRVGCADAAQYRDWCRRNGCRDTLHKTARERAREAELFDRLRGQQALLTVRRLERRRDDVLRALHRGEAAGLDLSRRPEIARLEVLFEAARRKPGAADALLRLLLLPHRLIECDGPDPVVPEYGRGLWNTYAGGLLALAGRHREWLRDPEAWAPASHRPRRRFSELARHLLCRYPAPAFLESAFFRNPEGRGAEAQTHQFWFIALGAGASVRSLALPLALTKKMAHAATTQVPAGLTVEQGWRWAQVVGLGGSERLARAVIATQLGSTFADEPFWADVLRWLADNPMLAPPHVGPLVDYLRYERNTPRHGDEADRDRLPAGFTMKGRAPAALLARMEAWHARLSRESRAVAQDSWPASAYAGMRHEDADTGTLWTVEELNTSKALVAEGRAMSHCVATYADACAGGQCSVWSVKAQPAYYVDPVRVMTVAVSRAGVVTEARGKRNALPARSAAQAATSVAGGVRLNAEEAALLVDSRLFVQRWAAVQGITLPGYLR